MKLAIGLIFSLAAYAECRQITYEQLVTEIWREYSGKFGPVVLPANLSICYGKSYFAELKGGSQMLSVLDRRRSRIILRHNKASLLRHELAHLYLDLRWKLLPYSTSEPLANALAFADECRLKRSQVYSSDALDRRWRRRHLLSECQLQQLFLDVMETNYELRESLPVR